MSSKDRLLKHSSESLSFHEQIPTEKISKSSVTLGLIIDETDDLIKGLSPGTVHQNGTVNIEHRSSENTMGSVSPASFKSAEEDLCGTSRSMDAPGTSGKANIISDAADDLLSTLSKLRSSSDVLDDPDDKFLVQSVHRAELSENPLDILHATESRVLRVIDLSDLSVPSDASIIESDQIDLSRAWSNRAPQSPSNHLSHSRNLSQTTSQLTNLKETASIMDLTAPNLARTDSQDSPGSYSLRTLNDLKDEFKGSTDNDLACAMPRDESHASTLTDVTDSRAEIEVPTFTDASYPDWKLDRRASGHLYWRRDSSTLNGVDPSSRVKFRYDIEVCEFEARNSETEDLPEEDETDDDLGPDVDDDDEDYPVLARKEASTDLLQGVDAPEENQIPDSRVIACFFAIIAVISAAAYRWFMNPNSNGD